jgi:hypothetical protein
MTMRSRVPDRRAVIMMIGVQTMELVLKGARRSAAKELPQPQLPVWRLATSTGRPMVGSTVRDQLWVLEGYLDGGNIVII